VRESLQDFRDRNHAIIAEPNLFPPHGTTDRAYPRCSGDIDPGPEPQVQDEAAFAAFNNRYDGVQAVLDMRAKVPGEDLLCFAVPLEKATIAGVSADLRYRFKSDKLDSIQGSFDRDHYSLVRDAVATKFGAPTSSTTKSYSNKMGAVFQGEEAIWTQPGSVIILQEVSTSNVDRSRLDILNPATVQALKSAAQKKANADF
jgi:hypothetical protein